MTKPLLVALTGKAGAGKDTAGVALVAHRGATNLAFADALKQSCMHKFDLSYDDVYTEEGKGRFVPLVGKTVREILELEGSEHTKPFWGEDFWLRRLQSSIQSHQAEGLDIVITDCRFPEEAKAIRDMGGYVIEILRPDHEAPSLAGRTHASNEPLPRDLVHDCIVNEGSRKDLGTWAIALWDRFKHGS